MDYISSCMGFLKSVSHDIQLVEIMDLELKPDNTGCIHMQIVDSIFAGRIKIPSLLEISIYFMVFDSYIESKNQSLEGLSFRQKYISLPQNTNLEKIIAQIYRILKVCRNAIVHSMSSIVNDGNCLLINYVNEKTGTNFRLKVSFKGIKIIKNFILNYLIYQKSRYSNLYKEYLFNSFYNDIIQEIYDFNDEDNKLVNIDSRSICRFIRYNCCTIKFTVDDDMIVFNIPDGFNDSIKYPIDIYIEYGKIKYIIPIEITNSLKSIKISELYMWKEQD
jgi:hypothetical protein